MVDKGSSDDDPPASVQQDEYESRTRGVEGGLESVPNSMPDDVDGDRWDDPPNPAELEEGDVILVYHSEEDEHYEGEVQWMSDTDSGYLGPVQLTALGWHEDLKPGGDIVLVGFDPDGDAGGGQIDDVDAASTGEVIDSIQYVHHPNAAVNLEDEIKENAKQYADATKHDDVAKQTFAHVSEFEAGAGGGGEVRFAAGKDRDDASVQIGSVGLRKNVYNHEFAHLTADAFGYGVSVDAARHADQEYDTDEDNFVEVNLDDADAYRLTRLEEDRSPPEEYRRLIDEVNEAWEKMQRVGQEDGEEALDDVVIKDNYGAVNAHETLAQVNEVFQRDRLPQHANWWYEHPGLVEAYVDVYEPSERMKELLTYLHSEKETSPFDSDPYPDIEPDA